MKLLVDAGNTRLKWALWDGVALHGMAAVANADRDWSALWRDLHGIDAIWIASVAGAAANAALERTARERFGVTPVFVASRAHGSGVHNAYAKPERLGVDRFLGLVAAHARARAAAVIAGCGTALILDAVAADGTHLGGLIAPGPD
ncbi:MAG: type III pantothenate kinase, partial [Rudaea sp.]